VLSSARGWFAPKPGFSFEIPQDGNFEIRDLNGDGVSDLVVQVWDEPTIHVFLSQRKLREGKTRNSKFEIRTSNFELRESLRGHSPSSNHEAECITNRVVL
jgi:uncharacterized protein YcgI (DUF1989 family)